MWFFGIGKLKIHTSSGGLITLRVSALSGHNTTLWTPPNDPHVRRLPAMTDTWMTPSLLSVIACIQWVEFDVGL